MGKPLLYSFFNTTTTFGRDISNENLEIQEHNWVHKKSLSNRIYMLLLVLWCAFISVNQIQAQTASNICPAATVNLMTKVDSSSKPVGAIVTWHTGTPATALNRVINPNSVGLGAYYASYYDAAANCFGGTVGPLTVTVVSCTPMNYSNVCPSTTVNLMAKVDSTSKPVGSYVSWHTGTPATAANRVANPSMVGTSGAYYVAYFDPISNCYGSTSVAANVTINACPPPNPTTLAKSNICPATSVNLLTQITYSGTAPANSKVTWHTASPALASNQVADPSMVMAGTYYPAYRDTINNCYGSTGTGVVVTINTCPPTVTLSITQPTPQTGLPNTPKTGTAPTDLVPTGAT